MFDDYRHFLMIFVLHYRQVTTHFKFFWRSTLIYTNQSGYASGTAEEIAIPSKQSNKLLPTRTCKRRHPIDFVSSASK